MKRLLTKTAVSMLALLLIATAGTQVRAQETSNQTPTGAAPAATGPDTETQTIENPFASKKPQVASPSITIEKPTPHRAPTYQNPFSAASKKPPVDTSLRPGPISRWQHPVVPKDGATSIKTAVLSTQATASDQPAWDHLARREP